VRAWISAHRRGLALLAAITVVGGALRAEPASNPKTRQSVDERAYARLARTLARHGEYGAREMRDPLRWAPGAPVAFAVAHEIRPRGTGERWDVPSAYAMQWAFATALVPAVFVLAALLAGVPAGLLAAAAIAVYPPLINATGDLLTEPLGALMLALALIATVLALRRPTVGRTAGAGALLGLTVLVRADLLPVPFLLVALTAGVAWQAHGRRRGLMAAGAMAAGVLAMIGPWSAYASHREGRFVPVSTGGASNLYVGTYVPGGGTMFGLKREWGDRVREHFPHLRGEPDWALPQLRVMDTVAATHPEEPDREAALRAAVRDNLRDHVLGDPLGYAAMSGRKVTRLWLSYTVGTDGVQNAAVRTVHVLLVLLGFAGLAAGLIATRGRAHGLWAVVVVVGWVTVVNVVLVSEARHNLPVMPVLVAGGAAGAALAVRQRSRTRTVTDRPSTRPERPIARTAT
jgi:4-amino-4-deoxy-L-arabinose transferase-like glycosyltransferase